MKRYKVFKDCMSNHNYLVYDSADDSYVTDSERGFTWYFDTYNKAYYFASQLNRRNPKYLSKIDVWEEK